MKVRSLIEGGFHLGEKPIRGPAADHAIGIEEQHDLIVFVDRNDPAIAAEFLEQNAIRRLQQGLAAKSPQWSSASAPTVPPRASSMGGVIAIDENG
jgi:hypothetical protein